MKSKILIGGAMLLLSGGASAATFCVNPNNVACSSTIQAAVDLTTAAGDVVSIAAGRYFESVTIATAGIILKPKSTTAKVFIDSGTTIDGLGGALVPGTDSGITVNANDVKLRRLFIDNSWSAGVNIGDTFTGISLKKIIIRNPSNSCVNSAASGNHGLTITNSKFVSCGSDAVNVSGDDVTILDNVMRHMDNGGILISGNDATVKRNIIDITVDEDSIDISGDGATVVANRIKNSNDSGIYISGDDAMIKRNLVEATYGGIDVSGDNVLIHDNDVFGVSSDDGIDVSGENPVITLNKVSFTAESGIAVDCFTSCSAALVAENRLINIGSDEYEGIEASASVDGMVIKKNVIKLTNEEGIDLSGSGAVTVKNNRIKQAGGEEDCIYSSGSGDHSFMNNIINGCYGYGINILGSGDVVVADNSIKNAGPAGVNVDNTGTVELTDNLIAKHAGFGVRVDDSAVAVTITGNKVKKNRTSYCIGDDGAANVTSFATLAADNSGSSSMIVSGVDFLAAENCPVL